MIEAILNQSAASQQIPQHYTATCSPDTTSSLTNILGWQPDMSYAPIRMIQIKSEEGKDTVRWERKEITVGVTEIREITITLPLHQHLINLSSSCAVLDAAGASKLFLLVSSLSVIWP